MSCEGVVFIFVARVSELEKILFITRWNKSAFISLWEHNPVISSDEYFGVFYISCTR